MDNSPRDAYLVAQVMTASPQKLHLMLIEAAIRFVHKAREHRAAHEDDRAGEALIRAQEIVAEMLAGFRRDVAPEMVRLVAPIYMFIYRSLLDASLHRSDAKLAEALKVLEIQRETWRQLCERLGAMPSEGAVKTSLGAPPIGDFPRQVSLEA